METINGSNFREGECGPCEYQCYLACGELIEALDYLLEQTVDMDLNHGIELTEGEKEFFHSMKRLCEASVATGNPIMF